MDTETMSAISALSEKVDSIKNEREAIVSGFRELASRLFDDIRATKTLIIGNSISLGQRIESISRSSVQQQIIHAVDSGPSFTLRYRNDIALGITDNPIQRLEWIAKETAYDPSTITESNPTGDMWPDDQWTPVIGGDAVKAG